MKNRKRFFFILPLVFIAGIFLLSFIVMLLWNAILPGVLHTATLNYRQALGLLILCRILFVGFGGRRFNGRPWNRGPQWRQKWMSMSDEERANFHAQWRSRCHSSQQKQEEPQQQK